MLMNLPKYARLQSRSADPLKTPHRSIPTSHWSRIVDAELSLIAVSNNNNNNNNNNSDNSIKITSVGFQKEAEFHSHKAAACCFAGRGPTAEKEVGFHGSGGKCAVPETVKRDGGGCTEGAAISMNAFQKSSFRWLLPRAPQTGRRLVYKSGDCNISRVNIDKRGLRYLADIFTTLVDIKWRWNLLIFALAFTLSWVFFAFVWWIICFAHNDVAHRDDPNWKPCVAEVYDFATALLFSIETQQTIGYGFRCTSPECPVAIIVMMIQSCFGIIIQALMTGLVFAKISRPKKRAQTLMFSKNALVCQRDDELCFLFRVGDMRKSHIVEAQVRAIMISKRVTREGEVLALYQRELHLGEEDSEGRLFLVWPVIVEHRITPDSPLWDLSAEDLTRRHFEILIILEGIVESTGMTTQARTSYLPNEILWGYRFERLVTYHRDNGQYLIDYSSFNRTFSVETSPTSAKDRAAAAEAARLGSKHGESSDEAATAVAVDEDSPDTGDEGPPPSVRRMERTARGPVAAHSSSRNSSRSSSASRTSTRVGGALVASFELERETQLNSVALVNCSLPVVDQSLPVEQANGANQ